jgi:phage gp46-like protein
MKDILIYETKNGGDLLLENNDLKSVRTLINQVYLAFFGGNYEQSTSDEINIVNQRFDWWGNVLMDTENQFNSLTERTLNNIVLNSSGVSSIENSMNQDLNYLSEYADIITEATIVDYNRIELSVILTEPSGRSTKVKLLWDNFEKSFVTEPLQEDECGIGCMIIEYNFIIS